MKEEYISGKVSIAEILAILDSCEAANLKHLQRIEQLETLCRDMYKLTDWVTPEELESIEQRMEQLGLMNTNSVHNELLMDEFFKDCEGKTPIEKLEALTDACRKQVD